MKILPPLTKKYILERVKEEDIMSFYCGVPVIPEHFESNSFLSPFRGNIVDNNPTCNYYYSSKDSKLRVRDWNGTFHGDCFDVASFFTEISTKTSQGFVFLLHKIASDFRIHQYNDLVTRKKFDVNFEQYSKVKRIKIIKVAPRKWNRYDKAYWYDNLSVDRNLLLKGKVYPVQELQIEGRDGYLYTAYRYTVENPAYAYYGGKLHGIDIWKIYLPFSKTSKFYNNYSFIQGYHLIQPSRIGILTKSYKDALSQRAFGLESFAVASEVHLISKDTMFKLKSRFDIIVTNFDYDKTGIRLANTYKDVYNCPPIMFTRGRFNQPNFGVKDFSEFRHTYGEDKTHRLIESTYDAFRASIDLLNRLCYENEYRTSS